MPKYLLEVSYTLDGIKGLSAEGGSARVAAVTAATEAAGGKIESFYFAFGDKDAYVIVDYPDAVTAAASASVRPACGTPVTWVSWSAAGAVLAVTAAGGARVRTVVLLTPAEVDAGVRMESAYRPPGG